MAILRTDCGDGSGGDAFAARAEAAARALDPHAPTVVLLHGFRYAPGVPGACPHPLLYAERPVEDGRRVRSWPLGLGFSAEGRDDGLCVAFGWRAREPFHRAGLGFAAAYAEAGRAGARLAETIAACAAARSAPVDLFSHSLGARVALAALRTLAEAGRRETLARVGRLILLGPAEFACEARATLAALDRLGLRGPEVYSLLAYRNARYDRLFEVCAPRPPSGRRIGLGREGLGARRPRWIDLAFDDPAFAPFCAERGVGLGEMRPGPCHWSFFAAPGAMDLHRAILRRAPGFGVEELRVAGAPVHRPQARRRRRAFRLWPAPEPTAAA